MPVGGLIPVHFVTVAWNKYGVTVSESSKVPGPTRQTGAAARGGRARSGRGDFLRDVRGPGAPDQAREERPARLVQVLLDVRGVRVADLDGVVEETDGVRAEVVAPAGLYGAGRLSIRPMTWGLSVVAPLARSRACWISSGLVSLMTQVLR